MPEQNYNIETEQEDDGRWMAEVMWLARRDGIRQFQAGSRCEGRSSRIQSDCG